VSGERWDLVTCPTCHGEQRLDFRDGDALIGELMEFPPPPIGIIDCPDCEGAGVLPRWRANELKAYAVAAVDQALAKLRHEGRLL